MTRYAPQWQQGSTYPAAVDRGLLSTLWPQTGFAGAKATTVTNTMNVSIPAGTAVVALASGAGTVHCRWDAAEVVTHPAAPPAGQSRIDRIVLQVRDAALDAGGNNDFVFQVIAGTPSTGTPAAPAVPTNAAPMYTLTVSGGTANLNGVTVTDGRTRMVGPAVGARVYQANAQTVPNGGPTHINYDTLEYDSTPTMWNQGAGQMIMPATGLYVITARCDMNVQTPPPAAGNRMFLEAWGNGVVMLRRGMDWPSGGVALNMAADLACQIRLNAGDSMDIRLTHTTGGAQALMAGIASNYFEIALLGT